MSDDKNLIKRIEDIASKINSGHYGQALPNGFAAKAINEQSLKITRGDFKTHFTTELIADLADSEIVTILNYRYNAFCKLQNKAKNYKSALLTVDSAINEALSSNLTGFKLLFCENTFDVLVHTGHIKPANIDGWMNGTYKGYKVIKDINSSCDDGEWNVEVLH